MTETGVTPMNDAKPVRQASAEWVAAQLRGRIIRGELLPGARIVERTLSAELRVSRTPVREALKLLRADGLVEIAMHRGAQVTPYTAQEAEHLFDLIAVIEGLAAERLVARLDAPMLERLEAMHARMKAQYAARDATAYFDTNTSIHAFIIDGTENPHLIESHRRVMIRAQRGRFMAILDTDRWSQAMAEHDELMVALRARDAASAAEIWQRHLRHTGETLAEVLRDRQP